MRTKIYGTIGPACQSTDTLVRLFEKGMTGIRLNLSHSDLGDVSEWILHIHEAYASWQGRVSGGERPGLELLIDLKGPELRIGKINGVRELVNGEQIALISGREENCGEVDPASEILEIPIPDAVISHLSVGQQILLNDGKISLNVVNICRDKKQYHAINCIVQRGGEISSGKSIALPSAKLDLPTLTESDLENIRQAKKYGVTGVMLPFVRDKNDLKKLKEVLIKEKCGDIRVFAKIENLDGLRRLPELLPYCDEVVIARGDLGNAMPLWELPVVQAQIADLCRQAGKPFLVVTQMLASMEKAAVPTRAEVSDIFRAVCEGAASVMLTGETAVGTHPVEAMEYMANTVREAERYIR